MVVLRVKREGAWKEGFEAFHEEKVGRKQGELFGEEILPHHLDSGYSPGYFKEDSQDDYGQYG